MISWQGTVFVCIVLARMTLAKGENIFERYFYILQRLYYGDHWNQSFLAVIEDWSPQ